MPLDKKPLGYISLLNNIQKPVFPMDDFFINFVFYKENNWNNLRNMLNIFFEAYAEKYNRQDGFHIIDEKIHVETQYEHYLRNTSKQPTQDIKIDESDKNNLTYIEFQNKKISKPPIAIRASNYSGLAINKANGDTKVSQVWLLAENEESVLCGQSISNFRMREDNTNEYYPRDVNIMFISLPRLMEENSRSGYLARLLMGFETENLDDTLKSIADMFKGEYEDFKDKEEVINTMTYADEKFEEGFWEKSVKIIDGLERKIIEKRQNGESLIAIRSYVEDFASVADIEPKTVEELIKKYS